MTAVSPGRSEGTYTDQNCPPSPPGADPRRGRSSARDGPPRGRAGRGRTRPSSAAPTARRCARRSAGPGGAPRGRVRALRRSHSWPSTGDPIGAGGPRCNAGATLRGSMHTKSGPASVCGAVDRTTEHGGGHARRNTFRRPFDRSLVALVAGAWITAAPPASAATLVVNTTDDTTDGQCIAVELHAPRGDPRGERHGGEGQHQLQPQLGDAGHLGRVLRRHAAAGDHPPGRDRRHLRRRRRGSSSRARAPARTPTGSSSRAATARSRAS